MSEKSKILVVDDELPVCKSVASALANENYAVDMALSGEEALRKEEENRYDIIVADLMMLGISGMDLLKLLKEKRPEIMVIMITGYPSIKTAVESIKLGAFDYLPKPFTPNELRTLISRALARKQLFGETKEKKISGVAIPTGLYCISENSWAKVEEDGNVRIGVHHILLQSIKKITTIEFPKVNETRYQGESCLWIIDANSQVHRLWTPVTGKIIAINEEISKDYSKLMKHPYREGWLLLVTPIHLQDDLKNLIQAT